MVPLAKLVCHVGMWGADAPTCRKPMLWKDLQPYDKPEENFVMTDHLEFYRRAIALRNAHPALRTGVFHTLLTDDEQDIWAFARHDETEYLIVILNASDSPRTIELPIQSGVAKGKWEVVSGDEDALRSQTASLKVRVPLIAGVVLGALHNHGN